MYIKLNRDIQKEIINKAVEKAGSFRKLSKTISIPRASLFRYYNGGLMSERRFKCLLKFTEMNNRDISFEKIQDNWRQIKGGERCVELKKKRGTFGKEMKKWQNFQSKKLKKWHKFMKENRPLEYYSIQYSRFKKIGGYKYLTKRGERVRNIFEKEIADILYGLNINYEYEPLVNIENHYFFPDFKINKILLECTAWKGKQKAYKLKNKINLLEKEYKVFVIIPKNLYSYYRIINKHLILGLDDFVPVAQTFLKHQLLKE